MYVGHAIKVRVRVRVRIRYQCFESQVMFFIPRRILPAPSVSVSEPLKEDER